MGFKRRTDVNVALSRREIRALAALCERAEHEHDWEVGTCNSEELWNEIGRSARLIEGCRTKLERALQQRSR
jgi:hypothetical protein